MKTIKHPLVDNKSSHYNNSGKQAIERLEDELTLIEMIGACKFNIFKYKARLGKKQDADSWRDLEKIKHYENYLDFLEKFNNNDIISPTVIEVYKRNNIKISYNI